MTIPAGAVSPFGKLMDEDQSDTKQTVGQSAFVAAQRKDPARWAKVLETAKRMKVPPIFVDQNFDAIATQDEHNRLASDAAASPGLAHWLKDSDNATIAKDEIPALNRVHQAATALVPRQPIAADASVVGTIPRIPDRSSYQTGFERSASLDSHDRNWKMDLPHAGLTGYNDMRAAAGQLAVAYGLATPDQAAAFVSESNKRSAELRAQEPQYAKEYSQAMSEHREAIDRTVRGAPTFGRGKVLDALKGYAVGNVKTVGELLGMIGSAIANPAGFTYSTVESLPGMAPALAVGAAGAAVGSVPGMIGGTFIGMAPLNVGSEINAEMAKRGLDITNPDHLRKAYSDPALMAEVRGKAARAGVTAGAVSSLVAAFAGGLTARAEAAGAGAVAKAGATAADVGVQAGGQGVAQLAGQVAGEKGNLKNVSLGAAAETAVSMLGYGIGETAIGASRRGLFHADPVEAAHQVTEQASHALNVQHDVQALAEIGAALKEAPVTSTVPDRVKTLIETATGSQEPAHAIYFNEAEWNSYWQSKGESPAKAAADIMGDGGKAYDEARTTGSPLTIPLSDYISKVAPTDHFEGLLNVARTEPDGMSLGEAHEYLQSLPATLGELAKEAESASAIPRQTDIRANIEEQLIAAGRKPAEAKAMGQVYESVFTSLGERAGIHPQLLFDRYRLGVRGPEQIARAEEAARVARTQNFPAVSDELEAQIARETMGDAEAAQLARPRTKTGRLKNLSKATPEELGNEYRVLIDANANENVAPTTIDDQAGRLWQGIKPGAMKAMGRVAARAKSIAKIEAELAKRGIEPSEAYMQASSLARNIDPTSFSFDQSSLSQAQIDRLNTPEGQNELAARLLGTEAARKDFMGAFLEKNLTEAEARQAAAERLVANRKALVAAAKADPQILDLKQAAGAGDEPRGRIRINPETRQAMIDLFKPADRSTFLHESGHLYLEVLGDLATGENASPEISKDYGTILNWLGVENRTQLSTEHHEQFARGFEAYLMEGKAPTAALREAFFRFKNWLTRIYKEVSSLNVSLSPEVRAVFDRILASDAEIEQAKLEQQTQPLFDDPKAVGLSPEEADKYSAIVNRANQAATEELTTRLMRELRREESKDWKILKEGIRSAVEQEAEKNPVLRALSLLTRGKTPLGNDLPAGQEPFKLSRQAIVDDFGKQRLESLPRPYVYSKDGGVHPDAAAEALGFASGDELLKALSSSEKPQGWINRETNSRMQAEHGERMSELQVRQAAAQAVRGEMRAQVLRKELEILASEHMATLKGLIRKITSAIPPTEEVRAQANKIIGEKSVKDIRPNLYERAARQQAVEAREALLRGDVPAAFEAKRKELLATEVLRAAENAKRQIQEGLADFRKVYQSDKKLAKSRDMDLIYAARSVLSEFEIGSSTKSADTYLGQLKTYDPEMADVIQTMVDGMTERAQNYKNMSVDEFKMLRESVKGLWNMSKRVTQYLVDGQPVDRIQVRDELIARAVELRKPGELPGYKQAVTGWEQAKIGLLAFKAVSRRIEHWIRAVDGGNAQGVFRRYLWNRVSEAATDFRVAKKQAVTEYADFLKGLKETDIPITRAKIPAPELSYTFSGHNELLGALLHRGNDSNFAKLLVGRGWGSMLEDGSLDSSRWNQFEQRLRAEKVLTKAHYDFIQGVWDRFDALKPGAQKAHKEQFGRYFAEITHKEFTNEFGTYKGGYYPAKVDPYMVSDAQMRADREALLGANTSFMFPTVGRGFTKERVENYRKPLILDASAVPQHFDAVLRFTHMAPAIRDAARVMMDPAFQEAVNALDPTIVHDALVPWLRRAGQQLGEAPSEGGKFWSTANKVARAVRNNAALQIMTVNSTVLLEQLTHFPSVFVRVDKGKMANAVFKYTTDHKAMTTAINERSPFMATRESAALTEARKQIDRILLDPTVFQEVKEFAQTHGRFLMTGVQSVMDHVTWQAAYDQALETMTEKEAAREADATVRELLGSYTPEDISRIEAGTPIQRLFTMFYGFFNTKANVLMTEKTIAQQVGLKKGSGRATAALFWGFMIPAFMGSAIKTAMSTQPFIEDDEGTAHALMRHFGLSQLEMLGRTIPFAGPATTLLTSAFGHGRAGALLDSPAVKMVGDAFGGSLKDLHDLWGGETEFSSKMLTDFFTLIGMVTGLPVRPLAKPLGYMYDVKQGNTEPVSKVDAIRGVLTGR